MLTAPTWDIATTGDENNGDLDIGLGQLLL
jgi:hypothetical protein